MFERARRDWAETEAGGARAGRFDRRSLLQLMGLSAATAATLAGGRLAAAQEATPTGQRLTVYSGRNENLVGPLIEQFAAATGIEVEVRYAGTAELAVTILGNRPVEDLRLPFTASKCEVLFK